MGDVVDGPFAGLARPGSGGPSPADLARYPLNDLGNGHRLILLAGGSIDADGHVDCTNSRLLYVLGLGWFGFNGRYWDREFGDDLARKLAHQVANKLPSLQPIWIDERGMAPKEVLTFVRDSGSAGKTSAMLAQAKSYITVKLDAFDVDVYALNCRNGTLKMSWVDKKFFKRLVPHDPADRITRCTNVDYDDSAEAKLFRGVVDVSLPRADERSAFKRAMGYTSTGAIHEQAFFACQGPGKDGKSTILDACRETLGTYATAASPQTFLEGGVQSGSSASPDLIALAGDVRFGVLSEPPRGSQYKEGLIKAWTSGSPVSARDLNAKPINFRPVVKLIWEMNSWPRIKGDDDGIWRRFNVFLFRRKVPDDEVDRLLPQKLRREQAGILNWLVEGVGDWFATGLSPPDSLRQVVEDLRRSSSPFGDWLSLRCLIREAADGNRELSSDLYANFKAWCEDQGIDRIMSAKAFGEALTDRQVGLAGKNRQGRQYRGPIRLKPSDLLAAEADAAARGPDGAPGAGGSYAQDSAGAAPEDFEWSE